MKCKIYLLYSHLLPQEAQNYVYESITITRLQSILGANYVDIIDDFQVLRPNLDISIKINKNQLESFRPNLSTEWSYCYIQWIDSNNSVKTARWYFIRSIKQVALDTIQLDLHMDVLNSFVLLSANATNHPFYSITERSIIKRLHKDRLDNLTFRQIPLPVGYTFTPKCDFFPEGINPILFKKSQNYIEDDNQSWYLVYANTNAPATSGQKEADYVNPVLTLLYCDRGYSIDITSQTATQFDLYANDPMIPKITNREEVLFVSYPQCEASHEIKVGATTYTLVPMGNNTAYNMMVFRRKNNNDTKFRVYGVKISSAYVSWNTTYLGEFDYVGLKGIEQISWEDQIIFDVGQIVIGYSRPAEYHSLYIGSGTQTSSSYDGGRISALDRTDSKLIKIVALPYCPFDFMPIEDTLSYIPEGLSWNGTFSALQIDSTKLNNMLRILYLYKPVVNDGFVLSNHPSFLTSTMNRDIGFETKLLHSEFYYKKLVYDSYFKIFRQELYDTTAEYNGTMTYAVASNLSSSFLLTFDDYVTNISDESYDNILLVDRVNELPLFNNAYINYLRTGFKYDVESNQRQNNQRILGIAFTTIGSVASFVSTAVTGGVGVASGIALATSSASQITGAIASAKQADQNIQARLVQASNQATSVSGASDFSLMKEYTTNQCKLEVWEVSDTMKEALYNLFYFCGYNTYMYAPSPSDLWDLVHSRQLFNFIQADIELYDPSQFNEDIANEIIKKWGEGITFVHRNAFDETKIDGVWVVPTQLQENIEVSQLPSNP